MSAYFGTSAGGSSRQHNGNNYNNNTHNNFFASPRRYNNEGRDHDNDNRELLKAVKQGQLPRVKYLIDCGADVDYEDTGAPLLSHAVRHGRVEIVKMLILAGADVNRKDSLEHQAIHEAASSKTNEAFAILGLLLWAGCEFKVKGFFGETPLHKAASGRIAKALIQAGADIESKIESVMSNRSGDGFTPLHEHARKGRIDIVKILIEAGANINARDGEGTTPLGGCLSLTRTEDRASTIAFLRAHGARE